MAAPSIPNLAALGGRGGARLPFRARRPGHLGSNDESTQGNFKDRFVQQTDNDAASSRMSAVSLGYLDDPFAQAFAPFPPPRRYPLINRGTYVRTSAIDSLIGAFLEVDSGTPKQIISLGAGSDTRFFRLAKVKSLIYHEIDFAANTTSKISKIRSSPLLKHALKNDEVLGDGFQVNQSEDCLYSKNLNIHALDLRKLFEEPEQHSTLQNLRPNMPTLILSECCLTYLPLEVANGIIDHILFAWLTPATPVGVVLYEPIKPKDSFGRTMSSNLASRNITMPSLQALPTLQCHRRRLKNFSTFKSGARTVYDIYMGKEQPRQQHKEEITRLPHSTIRWDYPDSSRTNRSRDMVAKRARLSSMGRIKSVPKIMTEAMKHVRKQKQQRKRERRRTRLLKEAHTREQIHTRTNFGKVAGTAMDPYNIADGDHELDNRRHGPLQDCGEAHVDTQCANEAYDSAEDDEDMDIDDYDSGRGISQLDGASDDSTPTASGHVSEDDMEMDDSFQAPMSPSRKIIASRNDNLVFWSPPADSNDATGVDMDYSEMWITQEERDRVEKVEWLDEVEEWQLLASHYCVVWGWRDGAALDEASEVFNRAWSGIAGHWQAKERQDDELHSEGNPRSKGKQK
ncbi:Leucine carboxyl methyltransferase-like protein [Elsinoe fawcettii]|nr:Leucine carboxyl methyltransferase-like protein [Elsinoe fawcettii]